MGSQLTQHTQTLRATYAYRRCGLMVITRNRKLRLEGIAIPAGLFCRGAT